LASARESGFAARVAGAEALAGAMNTAMAMVEARKRNVIVRDCMVLFSKTNNFDNCIYADYITIYRSGKLPHFCHLSVQPTSLSYERRLL
jgi:hypothetical protein